MSLFFPVLILVIGRFIGGAKKGENVVAEDSSVLWVRRVGRRLRI